jgi:5,10-methylene-tetrahydrofolate dehydrogenase/methenyl tetrahydrofolate cyclohydrolase
MVKDGVDWHVLLRVPDENNEKGYGDVDFDQVSKKRSLLPSSWWSGTMTIAMLLKHTLAREMKRNK